MQEFSSVTASSYDADSLAPMLADKTADGWTVISILAAGTNIVAYLQREADESASGSTTDAGATFDDADDADDTATIEYPSDIGATDVGQTDVAVEAEEEAASADDAAPYVPAAASSVITAGTPAAESDDASGVDEPAGWATAPESSDDGGSADGGDSTDASLAGLVAEVEAADATPEPAVEEPAAETAPVESTVPAGWYADPSGRFELRYWDGTAWTEHVSRAGQQFTDPPVA